MSEGEQESVASTLSSEGLQTTGNRNDGPRTGLSAHEGLQADDQGMC